MLEGAELDCRTATCLVQLRRGLLVLIGCWLNSFRGITMIRRWGSELSADLLVFGRRCGRGNDILRIALRWLSRRCASLWRRMLVLVLGRLGRLGCRCDLILWLFRRSYLRVELFLRLRWRYSRCLVVLARSSVPRRVGVVWRTGRLMVGIRRRLFGLLCCRGDRWGGCRYRLSWGGRLRFLRGSVLRVNRWMWFFRRALTLLWMRLNAALVLRIC